MKGKDCYGGDKWAWGQVDTGRYSGRDAVAPLPSKRTARGAVPTLEADAM